MYINRITRQLNRGMILVFVGQRRVGKSFILKSVSMWLKENRPEANVLFIDKEFDSWDFIRTGHPAHTSSRLPQNGFQKSLTGFTRFSQKSLKESR